MSHVFVIAEAGVNHNGDIEKAKLLVEEAARCGADVVKFQTYKTENLVTANAPKADYQKNDEEGPKATTSQFEMLKQLELKEEDHFILKEHCQKHKIEFMSSAFDLESLDFLVNKVGVERLKVPSGEITNGPLLFEMAKFNLPIILSSGVSTLTDIAEALAVLSLARAGKVPGEDEIQKAVAEKLYQSAFKEGLTLLHCTSEYPTPYSDVNLRAMETIGRHFELPVGLSDHSAGVNVPIMAATLGAVCIEKHFTLDKELPGPDHKASLNPNELDAMIQGIRQAEMAIGHGKKEVADSEAKNKGIVRKSLVAARSIEAGEVFSQENLTVKRPGGGCSPMAYWNLLGKVAQSNYQSDQLISAAEMEK